MEIKELELYMDTVSIYDFVQTVQLFEPEDKVQLREKLYARILEEKACCENADEETRSSAEDRIVDYAEKILAVSASREEYAEAEAALQQIAAARAAADAEEESDGEENKDKEKKEPRGMAGTAGSDMREMQHKLDLLALASNKTSMIIAAGFALLCVFGAIMLLAAPGVIEFFDGAWLEKGVTIICALIVIVMLFVGGFWGAVITLVILAGVISLISEWIGLGLLLRLILVLVLAVVIWLTLLVYADDRKKVKEAGRIDVGLERTEIRERIERMRAYVISCLDQCRKLAVEKETLAYYEGLRDELSDCEFRLKEKK